MRFGWTIFLWTFIFKLLLYPLEKDTLRSSAMTKMIAPKLQQIKDKYKDDEEMAPFAKPGCFFFVFATNMCR